MIDGYIRLFLRGFCMVVLVSANTYLIAHAHAASAAAFSTVISTIWFYNARQAAHSHLPYAGWVYGFGAGVGTLVGTLVASVVWGGR